MFRFIEGPPRSQERHQVWLQPLRCLLHQVTCQRQVVSLAMRISLLSCCSWVKEKSHELPSFTQPGQVEAGLPSELAALVSSSPLLPLASALLSVPRQASPSFPLQQCHQ